MSLSIIDNDIDIDNNDIYNIDIDKIDIDNIDVDMDIDMTFTIECAQSITQFVGVA